MFWRLTPSHQFPTGDRLLLAHRHQFIRRVQKNNAIIIKDDYNGECPYAVAWLSLMAVVISERTIHYCGTFTKILFASLRLGFAPGSDGLTNVTWHQRWNYGWR